MMEPTRGLNLTKSQLNACAGPPADVNDLDKMDISNLKGRLCALVYDIDIGADVRNLTSRPGLLAFMAIAVVLMALTFLVASP